MLHKFALSKARKHVDEKQVFAQKSCKHEEKTMNVDNENEYCFCEKRNRFCSIDEYKICTVRLKEEDHDKTQQITY